MPWDVTEQYIRSGHRDPSDFMPDSLRTVTLSESEGIKAIMGKRPGSSHMEIQSYLFDKGKGWTLSKAKEWFFQHKAATVSIDEKENKTELFRYLAEVHSPWEYQGRFFAKIRLIDTSTSHPLLQPYGVRVRASYEGLKKAIQRLLTSHHLPLVGPPEDDAARWLKEQPGHGHASTKQMGEPLQFDMPDGFADVVYEITDPAAKEGIRNGTWRCVSAEWRPRPGGFYVGSEGEHVLTDFDFERVAFVDEGAFPAATVQNFWEAGMLYQLRAELLQSHTLSPEGQGDLTNGAGSTLVGPQPADEIKEKHGGISLTNENPLNSQLYKAADAWNTADAPDKFFAYVPESAKGPDGNKSERKIPLASVQKKDLDEDIVRNAVARLPQADIPASALSEVRDKIRSAAHSLGLELPSLEQGGKGGTTIMTNENEATKRIEELTNQNKELTDRLATTEHQVIVLKASAATPTLAYQAAVDRLEKKVTELEAYKAAKEAETILDSVNTLVEMHIEAGICDEGDRVKETEKYKAHSASALDAMIEDMGVILARLAASGNKAQFKAAADKSASGEDQMRRQMGLPWRQEEAQ